ncbi:MAG: CHASE domain-containing protein [Erythrobacter sp.]
MPAGLFLLIAAITAFSVYAIESNARDRERAELRQYAQVVASTLDRRANTFSSYLRAGAALFASSQDISPLSFRRFVDELQLGRDSRGAEGIGWVEVIDAGDTAAYVERMRERRPGFPGVSPPVFTAQERVAATTYFAPDTARNRRMLGFDMYSDEARAAAMEEARRSVKPTASGVLDLVPDDDSDVSGFVIFMPVYRTDPASPTRERRIVGYLFSAFNAENFLQSALEANPEQDFAVRLYDGEAEGDSDGLLVARGYHEPGNESVTLPVTIANRDFRLVVESARGQTLATISMVTAIFGLAIACLLMLVARLLARQADKDLTRLKFYEEQQAIRVKLTRELNHRVKNTLANVLSILALTRRRASGLDSFADSLEGRIRALSATHDLLTGTDWGTTPIRAVIEAELQHFSAASDQNVTIDGPPVELSPNDALSFGLAIHELATNAAKFGALSVPDGSVHVFWKLVGDNLAKVEWVEEGGPEVSQERSRGFGTELIEKIIAHELRHRVELDFRPEGVRCSMGVPVRRRSEFEIRAKDAATQPL